MKSIFVLFILVLLNTPALAVNPDEMLSDPALETRARDISAGLRCVVCQNQSIDDSDAELAKDLRLLVRDRLTEGDSNDQVIDYVVSRYGDYVLLNPPVKTSTYVLWFGPVIMGAIGIFALISFYRRKPQQNTSTTPSAPKPLSEAEEKRLAKMLDTEQS